MSRSMSLVELEVACGFEHREGARRAGLLLTLKGITGKGKNRVRESGEAWRIVRTESRIQFDDRIGPWHLIVPANKRDNDNAMRWVHEFNNKDFSVLRTALPSHNGDNKS